MQKNNKALIWFLSIILLATVAWGIYDYALKPAPVPSPEPSPSPRPIPSPEIPTITIAVDSRPTGMIFYTLNHVIPKGKMLIKPVVIEDPDEKWRQMAEGKIDMAFSTLPEFVLGAARYNPGTVVCITSTSMGADGIVVQGKIKGLDDLIGKKISLIPGSPGHYLLVRALDSRGKSTSEVKIVKAQRGGDVFANFASGDFIDAAVLAEPFLSRSLKGKGKAILTTGKNFSIIEVLVAGKNMVEDRPEDIQTLVNGYFQVVELLQKNAGLGRKLLLSRSGRDVDEVDALFAGIHLMSISTISTVSKESLIKGMKKIQQIWSIEMLEDSDRKIDFEGAINYVFMEKASVSPEDSLFYDVPSERSPLPTDEEPTGTPSPEKSPQKTNETKKTENNSEKPVKSEKPAAPAISEPPKTAASSPKPKVEKAEKNGDKASAAAPEKKKGPEANPSPESSPKEK